MAAAGGRRSDRRCALRGLLLLLVMGPAPAAPAADGGGDVVIQIQSPGPGERVRNRVTMAPIRGRAQTGGRDAAGFDVMLVIDVSHSTRFPSGIDVDGDGDVGFNPQQELVPPGTYPADMVCTDPDDTILAAEVEAARHLVEVLDPTRNQIGVIVFSGHVDPVTGERMSADQRDAIVKVPLTSELAGVREALDQIRLEGAYGATNYAAAIQLSVVELAGLSQAYSKPRSEARKVVLFLTDGVPTFPFGKGTSADPEDTEAAIAAARLAHRASIAINSFALGQQALASPVALTEISRITLGAFTPVRNPGDIVGFLQGVSFASVEDVVITNRTTGEISSDVQLLPDGSFTGFVPVKEGRNRVEVVALGSAGAEGRVELELEFQKSELSERELALELERIKKRNKALMLLLEQKRIEAFRERQRKRVEIEAEER